VKNGERQPVGPHSSSIFDSVFFISEFRGQLTRRWPGQVAGAIDLAHAPFADRRGDFADAEARTWRKSQFGVDHTGEIAAWAWFLLSDGVVFTDSFKT
jgi:hypothetical protein